MSAYIHFFIRIEDKFYPIATYSRNSQVFELMHSAPYEHIRVLNSEALSNYGVEAREILDEWNVRKRKYEKRKELIATFNNSVEEKMEMIHNSDEAIEEIEYEISEAKSVIRFIYFLENIIKEVDYDTPEGIDKDNYLYYGIECYRPTAEDIEDK